MDLKVLLIAGLLYVVATRQGGKAVPSDPPPKKFYEYEAPPKEYDPKDNDLPAGEYLSRCAKYAGAGASIGMIGSPVGALIGGGVGCLAGIGTGIYDSWG